MTSVGVSWSLRCHECAWEPDPELEMGVAKAHFETEHDDIEPEFDLVPRCPRDQAEVVPMRTEHHRRYEMTMYDCPVCRRSYRVRWNPKEQPTR